MPVKPVEPLENGNCRFVVPAVCARSTWVAIIQGITQIMSEEFDVLPVPVGPSGAIPKD
jgi:hypothetical protein